MRRRRPLQLAGINLRLEQRRAEIPVLAKLADAQNISRISRLEEAAPLFFTHDMYKSYPISLLAKSRFDQLSKWLDRLTPYDLSGVAVGDCRSIDEWIDRLREQTPLDVATSSGTSGTMSFFPKTKRDYRNSVTGLRVQLTQRFGDVRRRRPISTSPFTCSRPSTATATATRRGCRSISSTSSAKATLAAAHGPAVQGERRSDLAGRAAARRSGEGRYESHRRARNTPRPPRGMGADRRGDSRATGRLHPRAGAGAARAARLRARPHQSVLRDRSLRSARRACAPSSHPIRWRWSAAAARASSCRTMSMR